MNKKIPIWLNKTIHGYANKIIPMRLRNKKSSELNKATTQQIDTRTGAPYYTDRNDKKDGTKNLQFL